MSKIKSLRAAIEAALPEFKRDPARLRVWVEDGTARSRQTGTMGFEFRYRLNVLLEEATSDIALVALAIFRWLRINQPDLLAPGSGGFAFDADILDNKACDILIQLELAECICVTPRAAGGWSLDYLPEPDPLFLDDQPPGDLEQIPELAEVIIAATQDP